MKENSCKILVVEHDLTIRFVLREVLESEGHAVLLAGDADEASRLLAREPGLVLMDVSGIEHEPAGAIPALVRECEGLGIAVAFMSSTNPARIPRHATTESFLRKPFELDSVVGLARRHCARSEQPRSVA